MSVAPLPPAVGLGSLFDQLRGRIRRYVLIEGLAVVGAVVGLCFWCSLALDYMIEWPRLVRLLLLVTMVTVVVWALVRSVIGRMLKDLRDKALALVLERRFPDLGDRLITTVELAERDEARGVGLPAAMLARTAREVSELTGWLNLSEVFNSRPLIRAVIAAAVLLVSMGGFAGLFGDVFGPWLRRNVLLADETYPRRTKLDVYVLAEPGERRIPLPVGQVYKHPRGSDFTILAEVPDGAEAPNEVQIRYRLTEGSGGKRDYLTRLGERQFRQTLPGLADSIDVWLRGGDYVSPAAWPIVVVDPPRFDSVALRSLFPEYTGKNDRDETTGQPVRTPVAVSGTRVTLPGGTDFIFEARVNKPLVSALVRIEPHELLVGKGEVSLRTGGPGGLVRKLPAEQMGLSEDGQLLRLPFRLVAKVNDPAEIPAEGALPSAIPLAAESELILSLTDADAIVSPQPVRMTISLQPDLPPEVDVRPRGIGSSITRQARIPFAGKVTDDYGVKSLRFDLLVDDATEAKARPFARQPGERPVTEFDLQEKLDVLPLDLTLGQRLAVTVVAQDGDVLSGPHERGGEKFQFTIVSNDDLLALVAGKELNLRRRFEQIIEEVKTARKDLLIHRARLDEAEQLKPKPGATGEAAKLDEATIARRTELEQAVAAAVERVNSGLLKNENELISVQFSFTDLRDEVENNAIPDMQRLLQRFDDGIIRPLEAITTKDLKRFRDDIGLLRLALADKQPALSSADAVLDDLATILEKLEAILEQMVKQESLNEVIQMLRDAIQIEKEILERTQRERKKSLLE
jgi:hypothetical protein